MNKVEVKDCNGKMSIEKMPEGCLFYDETGEVCMKVHRVGENNSDFCYYVNLRTSFLHNAPKEVKFDIIINSEVTIRTVW